MGLINVSHSEVTQNLTDFQLDLLKNPYALYTDKKAILVTYYNLNTTRSTLDEALKIPYSNLGKNSPLRFNKIEDFYIYGIDRISTNISNAEFGLESDDIGGDGIILPNTTQPYPGDYFSINMLKKKYLFQIKSVTSDTFENGNNFWRIEYKLEQLSDKNLQKLIVSEYKFHTGTVGTNFSSVIKKTSWDLAKMLDDLSVTLKRYYVSLFYNKKVQTYTFINRYIKCDNSISSYRFYDPFLIEFIIKNKVLSNIGQQYSYIDHKTKLRADFPIKYNKSIWRVLETRDIYNLTTCRMRSTASFIDDISTIFSTRYENYFELLYDDTNSIADANDPPIFILDQQVVGFISNKQLFDQSDKKYAKYNLIVKYFNDMEIGVEDIIPFEDIIETDNTIDNYFYIPMLIFILDKYVKMFISPNNEL
nr:MAG TPA: hypothetical protein [Caudoviricetes sp.]